MSSFSWSAYEVWVLWKVQDYSQPPVLIFAGYILLGQNPFFFCGIWDPWRGNISSLPIPFHEKECSAKNSFYLRLPHSLYFSPSRRVSCLTGEFGRGSRYEYLSPFLPHGHGRQSAFRKHVFWSIILGHPCLERLWLSSAVCYRVGSSKTIVIVHLSQLLLCGKLS